MCYQILLTLTHSTIDDMEATKRVIVKLSNYPVSIIIVGVGNTDFKSMSELKGDDRLLTDDRGN